VLEEVADGVHRLEHAYVNVYLVVEGTDVLLVDTGLPATWNEIGSALRRLGRRPTDIAGVVLTHAHFDHIGCAARLQERLGVPFWLHTADEHLAAHPYSYAHERPRSAYPLRHPRAVPILTAVARAGALRVPGVSGTEPLEPAATLPVPGSPRVVFSPGHTFGHCGLHLRDRDVVLTGDALVTLDPYTAGEGPQVVAGAATADSALALASLDALAATGATTVLPGHGRPWRDGIQTAVEQARAVGAH
jgi:glyoxylase-like metal-dependent hydrolase (beta-lactamase superfamily II)